ncbi:hypothetical protein QTP88_009098 [Uroleucon formosanum]
MNIILTTKDRKKKQRRNRQADALLADVVVGSRINISPSQFRYSPVQGHHPPPPTTTMRSSRRHNYTRFLIGRRGQGDVRRHVPIDLASFVSQRSSVDAPSQWRRGASGIVRTVLPCRDNRGYSTRTIGNWVVSVCWPHCASVGLRRVDPSRGPPSFIRIQSIRQKEYYSAVHPPTTIDSCNNFAYSRSPPPPRDSFSLYVYVRRQPVTSLPPPTAARTVSFLVSFFFYSRVSNE